VQTTPVASVSLWYTGVGTSELRTDLLPALPKDTCLVRSLHGAISRGTESLVFAGRVPPSEYQRMRAPQMRGEFPFPVNYGYCNVGVVQEGPANWVGQQVFSLSPHQTHFHARPDALVSLPEDLPPRRAVLAANMETALNAVWTAKAGPADRIAIVGGGVVGLLVAYLCSHLPGAEVTLIDPLQSRQAICQALGVGFAHPDHAPVDCDVVFHASANPAGLARALEIAGQQASVIELSWYGDRSVALPLGGPFHSRQLRLQSCQVGHIEASHLPRWSYTRRLVAALHLLKDARLDILLQTPIDFFSLPDQLPTLLGPGAQALCPVIDYP
jgi:hypothetical protein